MTVEEYMERAQRNITRARLSIAGDRPHVAQLWMTDALGDIAEAMKLLAGDFSVAKVQGESEAEVR